MIACSTNNSYLALTKKCMNMRVSCIDFFENTQSNKAIQPNPTKCQFSY